MTSSSAIRALISRSALADAAVAAVAAGGRIADLRGDAYGHGVLIVARAVIAAGAQSVVVDSLEEARLLNREGIASTSSGAPDIDARLLYGIPDAAGRSGSRPVLRLTGRVLSTKALRAGDAVSYGYTYRAPSDGNVALVTGGYAQGIVRALGNRAHVEINGVLRPIIGRVAMDVCVVDLDGVDAAPGDEVTYFGGQGPAAWQLAEWARVTGMTSAELLTVAAKHAVRGEED
ncbi:alanine racemase C-terminal domain-containing protein [Microbacterium sp. A93]|uniref:alanine racemase n=1 Tax=Microbacterium sp. A93 TaxID=3450716 RepID=UPI003F443742